METSRTTTHAERPLREEQPTPDETAARLEILIGENAKFAELSSATSNGHATRQAAMLGHPVDTEAAIAKLGLLTGAIPTAAIFLKLLFSGDAAMEPAALLFVLLVIISITATSAAGFYSGKLVGRIVSDLEEKPWILMLGALPFVGAVWGLLSGVAGGIILFGIGAIVGGSIGGLVGAAVLPTFVIVHRLLKTGDSIERKLFIPLSLGITCTVAAFILGL